MLADGCVAVCVCVCVCVCVLVGGLTATVHDPVRIQTKPELHHQQRTPVPLRSGGQRTGVQVSHAGRVPSDCADALMQNYAIRLNGAALSLPLHQLTSYVY